MRWLIVRMLSFERAEESKSEEERVHSEFNFDGHKKFNMTLFECEQVIYYCFSTFFFMIFCFVLDAVLLCVFIKCCD